MPKRSIPDIQLFQFALLVSQLFHPLVPERTTTDLRSNEVDEFLKRDRSLKVSGLSTRLTAVLELDRTELGRDYSQASSFV